MEMNLNKILDYLKNLSFYKKKNTDDNNDSLTKSIYNLPLELQFKIADYLPPIKKTQVVKKIYQSNNKLLINNFNNSYWSKIFKTFKNIEMYNRIYDLDVFTISKLKYNIVNNSYLNLSLKKDYLIKDFDIYINSKIKTRYLHLYYFKEKNEILEIFNLFKELKFFSFKIILGENINLEFLNIIINNNISKLYGLIGVIKFKNKKDSQDFLIKFEKRFDNLFYLYYSIFFPIIIISSHKIENKDLSKTIRFLRKDFYDYIISINRKIVYLYNDHQI